MSGKEKKNVSFITKLGCPTAGIAYVIDVHICNLK